MLTIGNTENHWTLLIDTRLKESAKLASHDGHFGVCPSGHLLFQSWDHTMCILHPTCFLHLLMIRGIIQSLKTSLKTSFAMAVYDFQAISMPITESTRQHGALFSASAETSPWWNLPDCTARILLSVDSLWGPDYWIFTTQKQASSPIQFQGPKRHCSLIFKCKRYP